VGSARKLLGWSHMLSAAVLLASAGFGATTLTMPSTSQVLLMTVQDAPCIKAGQKVTYGQGVC